MNHCDVIQRNNVHMLGQGERTLLLAHGFGCDQSMWRYLVPHLVERYRLVLFDYTGSGNSDLDAYDRERYATLEGYATDVVEITAALGLPHVTLVGHSVSSTIGLLAAQSAPQLFDSHVMICPTPCFLNIPPDYNGGFEKQDLQELLAMMEKNYLGWASFLAPLVMGEQSPGTMVDELSQRFCANDPTIARQFAEATFFSDYRHILPANRHRALILQSAVDSLAPPHIGRYMQEHMPGAELVIADAEGHCLHMTQPEFVARALDDFCLARVA